MKWTLSGFLVAITLCGVAQAEALVWKTETLKAKESDAQRDCKSDDSACLQADHVAYESVSQFGRTYYLTFEEAVRAYVSFDGSLDANRTAQQVFATDQITEGAFDWGGVVVDGQFKPLYVIKRFYDPGHDWSKAVDTNTSGLFVWRLSAAPGNGTSDMIGMAGAENAKARALAEQDFATLQNSTK